MLAEKRLVLEHMIVIIAEHCLADRQHHFKETFRLCASRLVAATVQRVRQEERIVDRVRVPLADRAQLHGAHRTREHLGLGVFAERVVRLREVGRAAQRVGVLLANLGRSAQEAQAIGDEYTVFHLFFEEQKKIPYCHEICTSAC